MEQVGDARLRFEVTVSMTKPYMLWGVLNIITGIAFVIGGPLVGAPRFLGGLFVALGLYDFYRRWARSRVAEETRQSWETVERALRVQESDPEGAAKALDELFVSRGEHDDRDMARLRLAARDDVAAARELCRRLKAELETRAGAREFFLKHMADDPKVHTVLQNLEAADLATRQLLAEVDVQVRRLEP